MMTKKDFKIVAQIIGAISSIKIKDIKFAADKLSVAYPNFDKSKFIKATIAETDQEMDVPDFNFIQPRNTFFTRGLPNSIPSLQEVRDALTVRPDNAEEVLSFLTSYSGACE